MRAGIPGYHPGMADIAETTEMPDSIGGMTCAGFLDRLASRDPVPGGGAAAGLTGAIGAALGAMVAKFSASPKHAGDAVSEVERIGAELERARDVFLTLADEDAAAYSILNAAFKRPKEDPGRSDAIRAGAGAAIQPPLATLATAAEVARLLEGLMRRCNPNLRSDLAIGARLIASAAFGALWNVRANASLLGDTGAALLTEAEESLGQVESRCGGVEQGCLTGEAKG